MKKIISSLMLSLVLLLSISACGNSAKPSEPAAEPETVAEPAAEPSVEPASPASAEKTAVNVFVLTGPTGVGAVRLWNAAEQGEGLEDYRFTAVTAPTEIVSKISSGEADIAAVSTNLASTLYHKTEGGVVILAVNTLGVLNVLDNTGADIQSMSDLRGRHIVTTGQGANPEFIVNYLLRANGVDPVNDVDIEFKADGGELAAVWATDPEAVLIAPQPAATAILSKYEGSALALDLTDEWEKASPDSALMMGCMIVRRAFLEEHPDAVAHFLTDYEASVSGAEADPAGTGALCEQYGIVSPAKVAEAAIPHCGLCFITGEALQDGLTGYLQVLLDADPSSIGGGLPKSDFWYAPQP